ncbi:MltA domain-containing protein [Phenylobacterium sp.]|uniref:MltA domain-containing protein n=1 Tax=Phenylobacterium sp. TaxID=1871053 RepID=UPI002CCAB25F|nr:MltA domain-containing protein [Phenylobacterium sp.]HLZ74265.1 MltA domain-containing protein [Phenylobacterium sp.]
MRGGVLGASLAALIVTACASTPPLGPAPVREPRTEQRTASRPPAYRPPPTPRSAEPEVPTDRVLPLTGLRGWEGEDHAAALAAFRDACGAARDPALAQICRDARAIGPLDRDQSKRFFEAHFRAEQTHGEGVLTAYFAPEYPARHKADDEFTAPVRARPADLGDTSQTPYLDRTAIEALPAGKPLAWMRPEDLFFLQIQGSGVLTFDDGRRMKALYAGNNGRPFVGVANPMRDKGLLPADGISAEAIRAWLAAHRGPDADAIMRLNPRYAFFSLGLDDGKPPVGSANVPLPGGRSLAIDPGFHQMGELYWVDASSPILAGAFPAYRRLALALDTGGAIKGDVRADLFMGQGQAAGAEAGRVRHTLKLYRLVPKDAAP